MKIAFFTRRQFDELASAYEKILQSLTDKLEKEPNCRTDNLKKAIHWYLSEYMTVVIETLPVNAKDYCYCYRMYVYSFYYLLICLLCSTVSLRTGEIQRTVSRGCEYLGDPYETRLHSKHAKRALEIASDIANSHLKEDDYESIVLFGR